MRRTRRTAAAAVTLASAASAWTADAVSADIFEYPLNPSATPVAKAMADDPRVVRRAVFSALPPSSKPAAVSSTRMAGFPRSGSRFAILSTGNARKADDDNDSRSTGSEARGPAIRGARDVTIMRIDLRVPKGANCLSFRYRFLSEEYPEFVDDIFNDAFIAELGVSNWDASGKQDPTIVSPNNFAVDSRKRPIRLNTAGGGFRRANANGTTYDGATRVLRASTPIRPGLRRLYLSIFDQGDRIFDSAVFMDKLIVGRRSACRTGVVAET